MENNTKKVKIRKIFSVVLAIIALIGFFVVRGIYSGSRNELFAYASIALLFVSMIFFIIFIYSLPYKYKEYDYNGRKIIIQATLRHKSLLVDGKICDEFKGFSNQNHMVTLNAKLDDGTVIEVKFSAFYNTITLRINGIICK